MSDRFTQVSHRSFFDRLIDSIKGVLIGILMFIVSFPLLWWNEGRAVTTEKSLKEGAGLVLSVTPESVDPANDQKLVHLTGQANTEETLQDPLFGFSLTAIRLKREVEMYQWTEEKKETKRKTLTGGEETVTTYEYKQQWSDKLIDSSKFKESSGHTNPSAPIKPNTLTAEKAQLGAFKLTGALIDMIDQYQTIPVKQEDVDKLSDNTEISSELKSKAKLSNGLIYFGANESSPQVGDLKVSFKAIQPCQISVIAKQTSDSFEPYQTQAGDQIQLLQMGAVSAEVMFKKALSDNKFLTWILRLVGFLLMWIGLALIAGPFTTFAEIIPFAGDLLGLGVGLAALGISLCLSMITISLAWIFYRPLIGLPLLFLPVIILVAMKMIGRNKAPARA